MLRTQSVTVELGRQAIVRDINFDAPAGQITAIVGPNGSGKTTLLRALVGELKYGGSIEMNGQQVREMSAQALATRRAVLAQSTSLAFPFKVYEIVRLGLTAGASISLDADDVITEALACVGLAGFAGRLYAQLSGGEKQRVQLARVLVQVWQPVFEDEPRFLFLDEPISNLDVANQVQVLNTAYSFAANGGAVIAVLHDLTLTAAYANQVALMRSGSLVSAGSPEDVFDEPTLEEVYGCPMLLRCEDGEWTISPRVRPPRLQGD
ncbi:MAG: heme ABC transporter ATP-binding protein [Pseudomonadota bacterium]